MKDETKIQDIFPTDEIEKNGKESELAERLADIFIAQIKFNKNKYKKDGKSQKMQPL